MATTTTTMRWGDLVRGDAQLLGDDRLDDIDGLLELLLGVVARDRDADRRRWQELGRVHVLGAREGDTALARRVDDALQCALGVDAAGRCVLFVEAHMDDRNAVGSREHDAGYASQSVAQVLCVAAHGLYALGVVLHDLQRLDTRGHQVRRVRGREAVARSGQSL